ncbi:MAG: UvrD-helicase domain-containing protein [Bryobacteraceae bacterium]
MTLKLDEKHHQILNTHEHGLVLGGPGSGKTTLALLKAERRIEENLEPGQGVLFLSFSRAAVARIADAMKRNVSAGKRSHLSIQTFHSFFWEILRTHGYLLGAPKRLSIVLAHEEKSLRNGIDPDDPGWSEWEQMRWNLFQDEGRVCFDLFAPLVAQLLARAKRIRDRIAARYPLIIVDEAQDTGRDQWECTKALAEKSQIICLADLDQLIFDHLPGVGPERVEHIRTALSPVEIDLGTENNRSPGTEIAVFARDVLKGAVRGSSYKNVSRLRFAAKAADRDRAIRQSIGIVAKAIRETTGRPAESIALIASYSSGVGIISAALRDGKAIPHQVLFDEAFVMLASRVGAFLLEPRSLDRRQDISIFLDLVADALKAKGGKTALERAKTLGAWANRTRQNSPPKTKLVLAIDALLQAVAQEGHAGNPRADWVRIKRELRATGDDELESVAAALDYLVAFNRGERIAAGLSEVWLNSSTYAGARQTLDNALMQEQLISGGESLNGIHVMNMHKCKGKQFDGVVLYRAQYNSPFVWPNDPAPHSKSRKVLHVAITRARSHVLVIDEATSSCPIIDPHTL